MKDSTDSAVSNFRLFPPYQHNDTRSVMYLLWILAWQQGLASKLFVNILQDGFIRLQRDRRTLIWRLPMVKEPLSSVPFYFQEQYIKRST